MARIIFEPDGNDGNILFRKTNADLRTKFEISNRRNQRLSKCQKSMVIILVFPMHVDSVQQDERFMQRERADGVRKEQSLSFGWQTSQSPDFSRMARAWKVFDAIVAQHSKRSVRHVLSMSKQTTRVRRPINFYARGETRHWMGFDTEGWNSILFALDNCSPRTAERIQNHMP